jgi:LuxR family maltose regulon positive regulatory protein
MARVRRPGPTPDHPYLAAKQQVPPARNGTVARERLASRLRGTAATALTLVCAPAGWGKTTLLVDWAHDPRETRPVAWLSLDADDDDPRRFWTYVVGALRRVAPEVGSTTLAALATPGAEAADVAVPALLDDLGALATPMVLVIDDYRVVTDPRIHRGVATLLTWMRPSLRLVLATRADPPLAVARLRADDDLTELRVGDLRFTEAEARALLASPGGVDVGSRALAELLDRTEGWPTGLRLAALADRDVATPDRAARPRGDVRAVADYFTAEVLPDLSPRQRRLLVETSPLVRLSGPLCDAVLETTGSGVVLDELDHAELFLHAVDPAREWYRVHPLLRDVLRRELATRTPGRVPELVARAAAWFLEAGDVGSGAEVVGPGSPALPAIRVRPHHPAAHVGALPPATRLPEPLTERELSVLRALQGTLSQREIGRELSISFNTVKGYTKALYRKLDVSTRLDAVARARALGIL